MKNMIEYIETYIEIQESIVGELKRRCIDVWDCDESDVLGWGCESHGEHICCVNLATKAQVEIPLFSSTSVGIDTGHFTYYLKTIGIDPPTYSEMHEILTVLEREGVLSQVQKNQVPAIWDLAQRMR